MTGKTIDQMVEQLTGLATPQKAEIEATLGTKLVETDESSVSTSYEFQLKDSTLNRGEVRLSESGEWAILILQPPEDVKIGEDELDFAAWGEIQNLNILPDVPPEGLVGYTYDINDVLVTFQFSGESRILDSVILEWGETS